MDLSKDHSNFGSPRLFNKMPKECSRVLPAVWFSTENSNLDERLDGMCRVSALKSGFGKLENWQKKNHGILQGFCKVAWSPRKRKLKIKILVKLKQERPGVREPGMLWIAHWLGLGPHWVSLGGFEEPSLHPSVALITAFWNPKGSYTKRGCSGCGVR